MYTYVNAIVKDRGRTGRWHEADLRALNLFDLWQHYAKVYLVLTHPSLPDPVSLDMELVRDHLSKINFGTTVVQWLTDLGNATLPTSTTLPKIEPKYVRYRDARQAGYDIDLVHRTAHPDAELPNGAKTDLVMRKPGVDYTKFFESCLVSVNGMFHRTDHSPTEAYVIDGGLSGRIANDNQVGITSFEQVGKIEIVPITPEMIFKSNPAQKLGDWADIRIGRDTTNKAVFMVIGGYLHVQDKLVKVIGDGFVRVDFNNYPLPERYFESRKLIDLSSLTAHMTEKNGSYDQVALSELYSDEVITAYLTLSQSFFVLVDHPDVFVERLQLEVSQSPGVYFSDVVPEYPVIVGLGRMHEYLDVSEDGQYVLMGRGNLDSYYNFETTHWLTDNSIDPTRSTLNPTKFSRGYFLKIGRDL